MNKLEKTKKELIRLLVKNGWFHNKRKGFLFRGAQRVRFEKNSVVFEVKQKPITKEQKEEYPCKAYFWKEVNRIGLANIKPETDAVNKAFEKKGE